MRNKACILLLSAVCRGERTEDTFMDVEERKALDEQAAAAASAFEPMADPAEAIDTEAEEDDSTTEEAGVLAASEDVIFSIPYQYGSLLLDIDTLSGMTDYRGAFAVNVTDEDGNTRYRLGFPESVWKEKEPIDLAVSMETSG